MSENQEKVVPLNPNVVRDEGTQPSQIDTADSQPKNTAGKSALFLAVLSLIILVIFVYGFSRNIAGITHEIEKLSVLNTQLAEQAQRLSIMEEKLPMVDAVPDMARRTVVRAMLQDVSQRLSFLMQDVETEEQSAKLHQAQKLLKEVEADLQE